MTNENRKQNIADEVTRAAQALQAAHALIAAGLHNDAVSRAYYGVLHLLRAALFTKGVEPKTHAGAIHLYNVELVRAGLVPATHNRVLAGLQRARELADYDAAVAFTEDDARAAVADAEMVSAAIREMLRREGWLVG